MNINTLSVRAAQLILTMAIVAAEGLLFTL